MELAIAEYYFDPFHVKMKLIGTSDLPHGDVLRLVFDKATISKFILGNDRLILDDQEIHNIIHRFNVDNITRLHEFSSGFDFFVSSIVDNNLLWTANHHLVKVFENLGRLSRMPPMISVEQLHGFWNYVNKREDSRLYLNSDETIEKMKKQLRRANYILPKMGVDELKSTILGMEATRDELFDFEKVSTNSFKSPNHGIMDETIDMVVYAKQALNTRSQLIPIDDEFMQVFSEYMGLLKVTSDPYTVSKLIKRVTHTY